MDIFESTLRLKKYLHKGNQQLIKINGNLEISGFSPLPILTYYDKIKSIRDYEKLTDKHKQNFVFDKDFIHVHRTLKESVVDIVFDDELTPKNVNTKTYWQFLHDNFPFCDVCSYFNVNTLDGYFHLKGKHYDVYFEQFGEDYFRDKKILEIGPGYGYLPKVLKEKGIPHEYYCADIVRRFDHDNFIDVDGYTLENINDKFDIILMEDVIQHLGIEIFKTYTKQIKNMLNWNGHLLIGTEMRRNENYSWYFFGQVNQMIGLNNFLDYMRGDLKMEMGWKPVVLNGLTTGTIFLFRNSLLNL